jgi:SagB-type dehydrogenase family enzyme
MFAMKCFSLKLLLIALGFAVILCGHMSLAAEISLPTPSLEGTVSVEEALRARRTHRSFDSQDLTLKQLSQILWAGYGVTDKKGYRRARKTAPSAGGLYPMDVYVVVGKGSVKNLAPGVYHFLPEDHKMQLIKNEDLRDAVANGSLRQTWMARAPIMIVITGEYGRSTVKYGQQGVTYTHIEAGCVAQNIFLQVEAMGLKAGIVGAFDNKQIIKASGIPADHDPLLIMPVGYGK